MTHIVVVGSSNTDLVVRTPRIPAPGETVLGDDMETVAGGKGANQAVAAARLGATVTFIARVGDDGFGKAALEGLRREGVGTEFIRVTPGVPSGIALITVREGTGENAIVVAPGANSRLTPEDVESAASAFATAQAVVISLEVPLDAARRAAEMGHERKIPVILNPAPARPLPADLLRRVSVLTPNENEARQLLSLSPNDDTPMIALARELLQRGIGSAVITVGPAGALIASPQSIEMSPGFPVKAVDTVAAGDCFTGALALEIAAGKLLSEAVRFANAAAALKVTRPGAQPGLPTRAQVEEFLARSQVSGLRAQ